MSQRSLHSRPLSFGRALAAAAVVSLAACSSDSVSPNGGQPLTVDRMNVVGASVQGGATPDTARQRTVITDAGTWTRFWAALSPDPSAGGGAPTVDFSRDMVIAAVMPLRPSSGYQIEIERVTEWADHLEASVVERVPAAGCVTLPVVTRPFDVVRVARHDDKPVHFIERTESQSCGVVASTDTVRAAFGKPVDARGVRVTLRAITNDSRCPINALCIWEGDAEVGLRFEQGSKTTDVAMHTNARSGTNVVTVGGVEFRLVGLNPPNVAGQPRPDDAAYTAILVTK
ncbi:MAG: protease complex subunit PrcB family protein [Gemmatirosa sp.]|nr:protease complex subunit PrcB family protein [Gemmatirosa sp.]